MYFPTDVAIDSAGNSYVVDSYNGRIEKFDSSGVYQSTITFTVGPAPGQMQGVQGIALDAAGNIYVTDPILGRVSKFTSDGIFKLAISGFLGQSLIEPGGIAVDPKGNIYVSDPGYSAVFKFNAAGTYVRFWQDDDIVGPGDLTFTAAGDLLVTSLPGQVLRIDLPATTTPPPPPPPPPVVPPPGVTPPPPPAIQRTTLRVKLKPGTAKPHAGKSAKFTATVTNTGMVSTAEVKVCVQLPKKAKGKVKAACKSISTLAAGHSTGVKITVKTTRKAPGSYKLVFTATSAISAKAHANAVLKVVGSK